MIDTRDYLNRRRRDFGDTLDVRRMDTAELMALLKAEAEQRGLLNVDEPVNQKCRHDFFFLRSIYTVGGGADVFVCRHCLERRDLERHGDAKP